MKHHSIKHILAGITLAGLILTMTPVAVFADNELPKEAIAFLDENGTETKCTDYQLITNDNSSFNEAEDTWLVFEDSCTEIEKIVLNSTEAITYHLIIKDDMEVNINFGIQILSPYVDLMIYAQPEKTGKMTAGKGMVYGIGNAAIGANEDGSCGRIIINGGIIDAAAGRGAAIGTGASSSEMTSSSCKGIVINGGTIYAESSSGAGIGCGECDTYISDSIDINGGIIHAISQHGAGIGSGETHRNDTRSNVDSINICGGVITAESYNGAGIGAGHNSKPEAMSRAININVTGGEINASSTAGSGIGIGEGAHSICRSISLMGWSPVKAYSQRMDAISRECEWKNIVAVNPMYIIKTGNSEQTLSVVDDIYQAGKGYVELQVYNQGADDMLSMPESYEYGTDTPPVPSTIPPSEEIPGNPIVKYFYRLTESTDNWTLWTGNPAALDVGGYEMRAVISETESFDGAVTESEYFEVTKGTWKNITPPKARTLSSNQKEQELVQAGSVKDARGNEHPELLEYSLDGVSFSKALPRGQKPGEYKVFWKIAGNENYKEYFSDEYIIVKIENSQNIPNTGDNEKAGFYGLMIISSVAALAFAIKKLKRKTLY